MARLSMDCDALASASGMEAVSAATREKAHGVVVEHGAMLHRGVVAHASGRPGPNAPTGDYRRSIRRATTRGSAVSSCDVSTNRPQGRRLELGFSGTDSLGRSYDQPPYPHFGPALDEVAGPFTDALGAVVANTEESE